MGTRLHFSPEFEKFQTPWCIYWRVVSKIQNSVSAGDLLQRRPHQIFRIDRIFQFTDAQIFVFYSLGLEVQSLVDNLQLHSRNCVFDELVRPQGELAKIQARTCIFSCRGRRIQMNSEKCPCEDVRLVGPPTGPTGSHPANCFLTPLLIRRVV